jgi:hypothetical protein
MTFAFGVLIGVAVGWMALEVYDIIDEAFNE